MAFDILSWINPFNRVADVVDQIVVDKDQRDKLQSEIETLKLNTQLRAQELAHEMRIAELNTKTTPVIDAIHKLGRQGLSLITIVGGGILLYFQPDINPASLGLIVTPTGLYNYIKGQGNSEN